MTTMNSNNLSINIPPLILKKEYFQGFLEAIKDKYELYIPSEEDGVTLIREYSSGDKLSENYFNVSLPIRNLFFPQEEILFKFSLKENYNLEEKEMLSRERVIFGVRPCDILSLSLLDLVFESEKKDSYYLNKRDKSIIIGLGCVAPQESCFCTSFGVEPGKVIGADISLTDLGENYLVEILSLKGESLVNYCSSIFSKAEERDFLRGKNIQSKTRELMPSRLESEAKPLNLEKYFESPEWQKLAETCLGCGICTYLCPTCHCFDISDKRWLEEGQRFRCWDSCMFSDFTLMTSGHNPRINKKERVRQRFMHKLSYFYNRFSEIACVGCGRCLKYCPVDIDITRVIGVFKDEGK